MTTTNVQKARTTVGDLAVEHALRAQLKMQQLKVSTDIAQCSASLQTMRAVITMRRGRSTGLCFM